MPDPGAEQIDSLLEQVADGDLSSCAELLPLVYAELRALAGALIQHWAGDRLSVRPTEFVHEVYLKLARGRGRAWRGRGHFLAVAAKAMRQLLTDQARRRQAQKRGGDWQRVTLDGLSAPARAEAADVIDLVALDGALARLRKLSGRQCDIVELRFFAGMTINETAQVLGVGTTTVDDDWHLARAWLARELA